MTKRNSSNFENGSLKPSHKKGSSVRKEYSSILPAKNESKENVARPQIFASGSFVAENRGSKTTKELKSSIESSLNEDTANASSEDAFIFYGEQQKIAKEKKRELKRRKLLSKDKWIARNGHNLTFFGIYLFTIFVFLRPYEIIPGLGFLSGGAQVIALATLAVFLPAQFLNENSMSVLTTEVKSVLAMTALALVTIPIAKSSVMAWDTFNDTFIKAVLIFIIMVNVVRTRLRLTSLVWFSVATSLYLSYLAINLYLEGEFKIEGYRVAVDMRGLFDNPNDMALYLATMTPIIIVLGISAKNKLIGLVCFVFAGFSIVANMVTFSRGGFLGLIVSMAVLVWKIGRKNRLRTSLAAILAGGTFILLAPGNYGLRLLSIFFPSIDLVGSADIRRESLILSIIVSLRNPWGIGIGNFPIVGIRNLQTHNAYTQVSSELGLLGLMAYLVFIVSPLRKLGAIEHEMFAREDFSWIYYLSIGLQVSIVAYMVSSFFASVAYNWVIYYLIAYAVCLRRIYHTGQSAKEISLEETNLSNYFKLQKA